MSCSGHCEEASQGFPQTHLKSCVRCMTQACRKKLPGGPMEKLDIDLASEGAYVVLEVMVCEG